MPRGAVDARVVGDRRADDHDAADDDRRRGDLEFAGPFERHADVDLDLAVDAEAGARLAGPGIERDDAHVVRAHEDARAAGGVGGRLVVVQ